MLKIADVEVYPEANHAKWVHAASNHVAQLPVNPDDGDYRTCVLEGLLQALAFDRRLAGAATLPKATLRVILWALSSAGSNAEIAFELLRNAPAWFQDAELQVLMQQFSMWQLLGRVAARESAKWWFRPSYFQLGEALAKTAQWEQIIRDDLAGWITVFLHDESTATDIFNAVLVRLWLKSGDKEVDRILDSEKSITLMFRALTKAWDEFDLSSLLDLADFCRLAKCTALAALRNHYYISGEAISIPLDFRVSVSPRLRDCLIQAAEKARAETNPIQVAATILERVAMHIPCNDSGVNSTDKELAVIRDEINASIDALEGEIF